MGVCSAKNEGKNEFIEHAYNQTETDQKWMPDKKQTFVLLFRKIMCIFAPNNV
jgi:hypothetical protein